MTIHNRFSLFNVATIVVAFAVALIGSISFTSDTLLAHSTPIDYVIMSSHSSHCLDVAGWADNNDTNIVQRECNHGENQLWRLEPNDKFEDAYSIISVDSGRCLDVAGRSKENGGNVIHLGCHHGDSQLWRLVSVKNGWQPYSPELFYIVSMLSGRCLDVAGWSKGDGGNITQWKCHRGDNQLWKIQEPGTATEVGSGWAFYPPEEVVELNNVRNIGDCDNDIRVEIGREESSWQGDIRIDLLYKENIVDVAYVKATNSADVYLNTYPIGGRLGTIRDHFPFVIWSAEGVTTSSTFLGYPLVPTQYISELDQLGLLEFSIRTYIGKNNEWVRSSVPDYPLILNIYSDPSVVSVLPNTGYRGETVELTVLGENLDDMPRTQVFATIDSGQRGDSIYDVISKSKNKIVLRWLVPVQHDYMDITVWGCRKSSTHIPFYIIEKPTPVQVPTPLSPPEIVFYTVEPNNGYINEGETATLSWQVHCPSSCEVSLEGGLNGSVFTLENLPLNGSHEVVVRPQDTGYRLIVESEGHRVHKSRSVRLIRTQPPLYYFYFKAECPSEVDPCDTFRIAAPNLEAAIQEAQWLYSNCDVSQIDYQEYLRACSDQGTTGLFGFVWKDVNDNSEQELSEFPIVGATVYIQKVELTEGKDIAVVSADQLHSEDALKDIASSTTTLSDGSFQFDSVTAGDYLLWTDAKNLPKYESPIQLTEVNMPLTILVPVSAVSKQQFLPIIIQKNTR